MSELVLQQLAPTGVLRVGLNMANFLLINSTSADGQPDGVSPAMARSLARELGVDTQFIQYAGPGDVADAAVTEAWDIGNIANEPERAKSISFSPAYCEIQATYLLPPGSKRQTVASVDTAGSRIAVKDRAAYQLWLGDHLQNATLTKVVDHDEAYRVFIDQSLDALAGLRPKLVEQQAQLTGSRVLEESFTAVQQSIGCLPGKPEAETFIQEFVDRAVSGGLVEELIEQYGVTGRLSVASR